MSKTTRTVVCLGVTATLSLPAFAWAQAVPRGSGGSSSSSSGSSGGDSSSSGSSGGSSSPTYSPPPPPPPTPQRTAPPAEGTRSGSAVNRGSGSTSSNSRTSSTNGGDATAGRTAGNSNLDPNSRDRNGLLRTGMAIARERTGAGTSALGNWGLWYPWYGSGLNWNFGYSYNPFYYGSSRWTWGRYGMWYDPFDPYGYGYSGYGRGYGYDPFMNDPFLVSSAYGYGGGGGGGGYSSSKGSERDATGSIRLRVKPGNGKVYVDGTLVGVVDDFDGLGTHLATTAGRHEIEIRADGYQPLKLMVDVQEDRTVTARGSMKKK